MKTLLFLLLIFSSPALANEMLVGTFSSVSESECNWSITLRSGGGGEAISTCRNEGGSQSDEIEKFVISWETTGQSVAILIDQNKELLSYQANLSCSDFGSKGSAPGLVLTSEENSRLWGVGGKFWKSTNCE